MAVLVSAGCELVVPSEHELSGGTNAAGGDAATSDAGGATDGGASDAGSGVSFVTAATATALDASALTVTLPEPPREGDMLLALVYDGFGEATPRSSVTPPAGFVKQAEAGYWWTFYAFAPANAGTTFAFAMSKGASAWPQGAAVLAQYRGVDPASPIADAQDVTVPTGTSSKIDVPSISPTRPGSMLVLLAGVDGANGSTAWFIPEGMTKRGDVGFVALADAPQSAPGPSGAKTATHTVTGWSSYANFVALSPRP